MGRGSNWDRTLDRREPEESDQSVWRAEDRCKAFRVHWRRHLLQEGTGVQLRSQRAMEEGKIERGDPCLGDEWRAAT